MTGALQLQPPRIPFPPSIIQPEEEGSARTHTAEAALPSRAEQPSELGWGRGEGTGKREHYLLKVFKFIARMMFLISTAAIN